jgi:hypothetical protein
MRGEADALYYNSHFNKFQTIDPLACLKYKEIRECFILTVSVFVEWL